MEFMLGHRSASHGRGQLHTCRATQYLDAITSGYLKPNVYGYSHVGCIIRQCAHTFETRSLGLTG